MRYLSTLLMFVLLVAGCTQSPEATPSTVTSLPSNSPTAQTSQPSQIPTPATSVSTHAIPQPSDWSPRDVEIDSEHLSWVVSRDVDEILAIWQSFSCGAQLMNPDEVLEATFTTADGSYAVIEVAKFPDPKRATSFLEAYIRGTLNCQPAPTQKTDSSFVRIIESSIWTEIIKVKENYVIFVTVNSDLDSSEIASLEQQVLSG